jgi:hypothetical protein
LGWVAPAALAVLKEPAVERKKTVTKKIKVTKNKVTKRGRPKLGEVSLTAAEKMRRYREKKREEGK